MEAPTWENTLYSGRYPRMTWAEFRAHAAVLGYPYYERKGMIYSTADDNAVFRPNVPLTADDLDASSDLSGS